MGLFSFTQEIAIDLGTANTIIIHNDKIVVDEPSVVALDRRTDKLIAIGERARQMQGKENEGIRTVRPLRDGVIADFYAAELMIRGMIKMIPTKSQLFSPSLKMVVCIPSGSTEVELRAVRDSAEHAGGRDVYLIYEPMAAALGIGLDVEAQARRWVALAARVEGRFVAGSLQLQVQLQRPRPPGGALPEAQAQASPRPGEEGTRLLQFLRREVLEGAHAGPPAHQEEARQQAEDGQQQVVPGVEAEQEQGRQDLKAQGGDGDLELAVLPEAHGGVPSPR